MLHSSNTMKKQPYLFILSLLFLLAASACKTKGNSTIKVSPTETDGQWMENIPECFHEELEDGDIASIYSYTFGKEETVYLVSYTENASEESILYSADCLEICEYHVDINVWQFPCAAFPQRSANEKKLYPVAE